MKFTDEVLERTQAFRSKTIIIAGWWYNELMVKLIGKSIPKDVKFVFYCDRPAIDNYTLNGFQIFYLPEQEKYNDEMFGITATRAMAQPFPLRFY